MWSHLLYMVAKLNNELFNPESTMVEGSISSSGLSLYALDG